MKAAVVFDLAQGPVWADFDEPQVGEQQTLSEQGQAIFAQIARARQKLMNQVLANWSPEEVQALFTLTRKYADSLQQQ